MPSRVRRSGPGPQMTPVVGEICYAVIMVDTALIARTHAMVHEVDDARSQLTRIRSMHWPALR